MLQKVANAIKAANDDLYAILKYNVRDSSWEIWIDNKPAEVNFKDYNKAEDRCEDLNYLYAARKAVEALVPAADDMQLNYHKLATIEGYNFVEACFNNGAWERSIHAILK